jgi:SAM-dependent methyltransferase
VTGRDFVLPGRVHQPELMDTEPVNEADLARCLRDLERVNMASLGYRPTLDFVERAIAGRRRISILDAGCGGGDMLRRLDAFCRRRGIEAELTGVDLNPAAIATARAATPPDAAIRYMVGDAMSPEHGHFDLIVSALFAHHLDDPSLLRFVRWMEGNSRLGWFINDLNRHWAPHRTLQALFHILPVHRFVRNDGPVSVRRAFIRDDLRALAAAAGLSASDVELRWWFPFRWGLGRLKPEAAS